MNTKDIYRPDKVRRAFGEMMRERRASLKKTGQEMYALLFRDKDRGAYPVDGGRSYVAQMESGRVPALDKVLAMGANMDGDPLKIVSDLVEKLGDDKGEGSNGKGEGSNGKGE